MSPSSFFCLTFFFIASLSAFSVSAQPPTPAPDCNAALVSLLPCLDYVQGNVSAPSQNCCVGLGSVVQSNPICLCALFSPSALPIQVNTTLALQLPALCKVAAPDRSLCGGNGSTPVQEPVPSPPVTTPVPPTTAPVPPTTAPVPPTTAPATPPSVPPSAGTPPMATVTPPASSTPVMAPATPTTPAVAPSTPMTPSVAPSTTPSIAPSVAPVVAPSAPTPVPTLGSPTPTPSPLVGAPGPSPESTRTTPIPSVSSPPSPPPNDNSHAAPYPIASVLSAVVMVFSILFLQM